jgi:protein-disulfide isomerase
LGRVEGVSTDPHQVVARVLGHTVTEGDLAEASKVPVARLETEHAQQVYDVRSQTLDELINQRLLEEKAKAEGTTTQKLVEREVTTKVPAPTDAQMRALYEQNKAGGRDLPPFDTVKEEIANAIRDRGTEDARRSYLERLKAEAKVERLLGPLLLPKVAVSAADGQVWGNPTAPITIVEFSDFQCPFCGQAEATVRKVLERYQGKVRLVYRDYPLPFHAMAEKASEAALCAADQGKYWEMHERLFADQAALAVVQLESHARQLGLDVTRFDQCLSSGEKSALIDRSKKAGEAVGVNGTPAFFINGRPLFGAVPFEKFKDLIEYELRSAGG